MSAGDPSLDDLIRAQRAVTRLTDAQRARIRARLLPPVLAGTAASAAASATNLPAGVSSFAASWAVKLALGLLVAAGAGAAYLVAWREERPPASAPAPQLMVPGTSAPEVAVANAVPQVEPIEPAASAPTSPAPTKARGFHATSSTVPAASASLAVEVQLMHDVDTALRAGQPERALALLDERRGHDGGFMGQERAAARVVTLCQLGRVEEARADAARFLRELPHSPLAARVRSTCASPAATAGTRP